MRKLGALVWALIVAGVLVGALELGLRTFMGFGNPILYDNTYITGFRPLPNQETHRTGGKHVRINNLALRGSRDWPSQRTSGQIRILYLGDSVTWGGSYVDDRETFAEASGARLGAALGRDVLTGNGGVNGWGPKNILGLVSRIGCCGADVVVVVALEADLNRELAHIAESPFWNHRPSSALEELMSSWVAYKFGNRRFLQKDRFVSAAERDSFCLYSISDYVRIGQIARSTGARRVPRHQHPRTAAAGEGADQHREAFLSACRDAGLPCLDLLPVMEGETNPTRLYVDPIHLAPPGHTLYGSAFAIALAPLIQAPN